MTRLLQTLRGLLGRVTAALRHVRDTAIKSAATGLHRVQEALSAMKTRHTARWDTDGAYRRTLAAALVAVISTALPHRAVAAALAALVAETTATRPRPTWDEDDDTPRWSSSPADTGRYGRGGLWDQLQ